jgi:hypothetical protein
VRDSPGRHGCTSCLRPGCLVAAQARATASQAKTGRPPPGSQQPTQRQQEAAGAKEQPPPTDSPLAGWPPARHAEVVSAHRDRLSFSGFLWFSHSAAVSSRLELSNTPRVLSGATARQIHAYPYCARHTSGVCDAQVVGSYVIVPWSISQGLKPSPKVAGARSNPCVVLRSMRRRGQLLTRPSALCVICQSNTRRLVS